jgi:hypothetical protein
VQPATLAYTEGNDRHLIQNAFQRRLKDARSTGIVSAGRATEQPVAAKRHSRSPARKEKKEKRRRAQPETSAQMNHGDHRAEATPLTKCRH